MSNFPVKKNIQLKQASAKNCTHPAQPDVKVGVLLCYSDAIIPHWYYRQTDE